MKRFKVGQLIKFKGYSEHLGRIRRIYNDDRGLRYRVWCPFASCFLTWHELVVEDAVLEALADV